VSGEWRLFIALCLVLINANLAWAQATGSRLYFANDKIRVAKLIERKEVLDYRVVPAGERRYREIFFDSPDLYLYHRRMFYRVKESFDGRGQIDFSPGGPAHDGNSSEVVHSVALSAAKLLAAREGRLDDPALHKRLSLPAGRELNSIQLAAEYSRHSIALERAGKQELLVSLLVGSLEGFSGKKLRKEFWALEVEGLPGSRAASQTREVTRVTDYLVTELKLASDPRSLYAQGIEKAVLLRSGERLLQPVTIVGGARGNFPEQFNEPDSVAFTLDGKLLAADTNNARFKIYAFDDKSHTIRIVGREGSAAGEFSHAVANIVGSLTIYHQVQGIAVDQHGFIHVIDQGNQRIQVFDAEGKVLPEKAIPLSYCQNESPRCADGLWRPTSRGEYTSLQGLAIDHEGGIFVSDAGTSRIYRFLPGIGLDPRFKAQELDPATGKPILKEPESLALYQDKLFVANEGTGDIKILDRRSGKLVGAPQGFGGDVFAGDVEGLAVAGDYLYALDVHNSRIAVFDIKSETPRFLLGLVGDHESADGVAVDPTGKYLAIADQGNFRIILYSLSEILSHLAAAR
jgi:DNA-binding beta-propeller fold protein YncE